ncbi:hypothetical protein MTO96_000861 [Rhipicephalus appendiculatus]
MTDRVVFITGGTGFIGKVLLEKLLRSCPGLKRIYLLVRSKRGENPRARLEKMFDSKAFVHVSTAYCNCDKPDVLEMIYPAPLSAEKLIDAAQSSNKDMTVPEEDCLYGHPNTYTLTKRVAESLILAERGEMPVAIVRPSIVTASIREPLPGWVDSYNGCTGVLVVLGLGLLQSILLERTCVADVIPVDVVANTLICVAWHTAETRPKGIEVYHCTSGALTPRTWGYIADETQRAIWRHPLPNAIRFPKFQVTSSQLWHAVNLWCLHYLPARVVDLALHLYGHKPRFVRNYEKICKAMDSLQYFYTNEWLFRPNSVLKLLQELSPTDAQLFNIDVQRLEWRPYLEGYLLGIRKYLLKVEDSELPEARKHLKRLNAMRWFWYFTMAAISCGLVTATTTWDIHSSLGVFATGLCDMIGF